jgi:hypothetical protein
MTLKPAHENFTIWKGATFTKRLTYYLDRQATQPRPLSSGSAVLTIRDAPNGNVLLTLTDGDGITLDDSGNITITIDSSVTATLDWQVGVYELFLTVSAQTDVILMGSFSTQAISLP